MIALFDVATRGWQISGVPEYNQADIVFQFRDGGFLPVVFDKAMFGYELSNRRQTFPRNGYMTRTDQDTTQAVRVPLAPETAYTLEVWFEDSTGRVEGSMELTTPPNPYPQIRYVRKILILERLEAEGLQAETLAALKSDEWLHEKWSAATEIDAADEQVRGMLTAIGADPDEILAPE